MTAIELKTGTSRASRREDYATKCAGAAIEGECPLWLQFLDAVTAGDGDLQAYLQRVAGYCLTGVTIEHVMFFLHGSGANGKSVFINTLVGAWGDYAAIAPMETFVETTQSDRHPTELAKLRGARLVVAQETEQGRRWAEAKIKALTGGDKIAARFMRQDFFEFTPQFKLMIAGNHRPSLTSVDEAIRRRIHLIPFTVTISPEKRNLKLGDELRKEWGGILKWAVAGCLEWQRIGLAPPVGEATATQDKLQARAAKAIAAAFRELENPVEIDAELPALLPAPDIEGPSPVAAAAVEPVPATVKVEPILSARAARLRDPQWRKKPG